MDEKFSKAALLIISYVPILHTTSTNHGILVEILSLNTNNKIRTHGSCKVVVCIVIE